MKTLTPKFIPMPIAVLKEWYWLVEACIVWYLDFYQNQNEDFNATNEELSELLLVSESTIKRALKNLNDDWIIEISKSMKEWGWQLRKISLTEIGLLLSVNLNHCKGSIWPSHNIIQEEKKSKKEKADVHGIDELVEAYREDERINEAFLEEDIIEWLKFKRWRKEYYATTKSFLQQMIVIKRMITNGKPQLDIPKRFNFAVNNAIGYGWKWIHRDDNTERQYLASKKDLFKIPNQDE